MSATRTGSTVLRQASSLPASKATTGKKAGKNVASAREGAHKAELIALIQRKSGATLDEIMKATGCQKHYADVRIMPTCVGNPACGAGIAAMESA